MSKFQSECKECEPKCQWEPMENLFKCKQCELIVEEKTDNWCTKYWGGPTGLGDTVKEVLEWFGVYQKLSKKNKKKTCGCSKRQITLNKLVTYRNKGKRPKDF